MSALPQRDWVLAGTAGDPGLRLLAGPPPGHGAETLSQQLARLGPRPPRVELAEVSASGLTGRGGGGFPFADKLAVAARAGGRPLVVVNASESEPASRKDRTLLELRPHLVIDGALVAAATIGAEEVAIYLHARRHRSARAVAQALAERREELPDRVDTRVVEAPGGYLAGESSAVVAVVEGGAATPSRRPLPAAHRGVFGRPTLISNAETFAHLALIARFGADWYRSAGTARSPGSTLLTLAGAVREPGAVVEMVHPLTVGQLLSGFAGHSTPPRAVLLGGYAGSWLDGSEAWQLPLDRSALAAAGAGLGCGLVAVLAADACGPTEAGRLFDYLAGQRAGQCGPCRLGLPDLAERYAALLAGRGGIRPLRRMYLVSAGIMGRGACAHPDGAVRMLDSALEVFAAELREHARRGRCRGDGCAATSGLPLPSSWSER